MNCTIQLTQLTGHLFGPVVINLIIVFFLHTRDYLELFILLPKTCPIQFFNRFAILDLFKFLKLDSIETKLK